MRLLTIFFAFVLAVTAASVNEIFGQQFREGLDLLRHSRKEYPRLYQEELIDALKPFLRFDWAPLLAEVTRCTHLPKIVGEHINAVCQEDTFLLNYHDKHLHAFLRYIKALYIACAERKTYVIVPLALLGLEVFEYVDMKRLQSKTRNRVEKAHNSLKSIYSLALLEAKFDRFGEKPLPVVEPHYYVKDILDRGSRELKGPVGAFRKPLASMLYDLAKLDWKRIIRYLPVCASDDPAITELPIKIGELSDGKWKMKLYKGEIKNLPKEVMVALRLVDDVFKIADTKPNNMPQLLQLLAPAADALLTLRKTYSHEGDKIGEILKKWMPKVNATLSD